ncbi:MAG: hypothetical protein OEY77_00015 [Nitrospira sp.]|nr:hypothetical protein [Nitrospira sp.]
MAIQPIHDEYEEDQRALVVATDWLDQTCSTAGCTVVIRCRAGRQSATLPVCQWCQAGTAYYRRSGVSPDQPKGGAAMTLDEFGRELYDAIVLRSVSVMAEKAAVLMRSNGMTREAEENEQAAKRSSVALERIFDQGVLKPQDIRRILAIQ